MQTKHETRDSVRFTRLNSKARKARVTLEVNLPPRCTARQAKAYLNAALTLDKRVDPGVEVPIDCMGHEPARSFAFRVVEVVIRPKKVRCTCARCGKVKYLLTTEVDVTEPFLCDKCDSAFITWQAINRWCTEEKRSALEHFLVQKHHP